MTAPISYEPDLSTSSAPAAAAAASPSRATGGGVMGAEAQEAFAAEVGRLRASNNSGPLDRRVAALGVVLAVSGIVVVVVAYAQSTAADDVRDQMEGVILALLGVALTVFGSVLYARNSLTRFLRHWLLRVVYEQRDLAGRVDEG